ncbi:TetR/AcrR family transcriptional regulator [Nonomuraea basaltis]|uniref:TetR/AcrR family transcriptional regulator n=1 Tax=Nonomuraea basaltis TaxID=2495887 RepID=UPI00110C6CD4|nr:TetR/AcrR family transcriptional regulator [Nonomuraea basaltis]TMR91910.1 TetR/AcrR family transcriptional regulator [Nonomuraea basaltis]
MLSHAKGLQIAKAAMGVRLSAGGTTPSIDEITAAADVSRRTVYMYFPSLDHLLIDATAGAINEPPVEEALADPALAGDAAARVEALTRTLLAYSPQSLPWAAASSG